MNREASDDKVQELLDRMAHGDTREDVLARAGDDLDAASCALLATRLAEMLPDAPDPAFRARLQLRLQLEHRAMHRAPQQAGGFLSRISRGLWPTLRRLAPRALSFVLAVSLVMGSAVLASADSLPGDSLYGVKRTFEDARLQFAFTPTQRLDAHQHQADERLWEIRRLMAQGMDVDPALVDELRAAQDAALDVAASEGPVVLAETESNAADTVSALSELAEQADPELETALNQAADAIRQAVDPDEPSRGGAEATTSKPDDPVASPPTAAASATHLPKSTVPLPVVLDPTKTPPGQARTATATVTDVPRPSARLTQPVSAHTPVPPGPTTTSEGAVPETDTPEPETPRPTSEREGNRAATLTAEAAGPTPQSVAPHDYATPTPPPESPPTERPARPPNSGGRQLVPPLAPRSWPPTVRPAP